MKKRKFRLKNIKRQLILIFKFTIPTSIIMILGIVIVIKYTQINRENVTKAVEIFDNAIQTESNMVSAFIEYAGQNKGRTLKLNTARIQKDHDNTIKEIRDSIPLIEKTVDDMFLIVGFLLVVLVVQFIYLFIIIIASTNRIYGPEKLMIKMLNNSLKGIENERKRQRKSDEMKRLFEQVTKICDEVAPLIKRRKNREKTKVKPKTKTTKKKVKH